jgi:hypothetical protein
VPFLLCDAEARVVGAVHLHALRESEREQDRLERLGKVLRALGLPVFEWHEGELPDLVQARHSFQALLAQTAGAGAPPSPVRTIDLAETFSGDAEAMGVDATDFGQFTTLPAPLDSRLG